MDDFRECISLFLSLNVLCSVFLFFHLSSMPWKTKLEAVEKMGEVFPSRDGMGESRRAWGFPIHAHHGSDLDGAVGPAPLARLRGVSQDQPWDNL